jgi:Ca2+-binding RTX toxin-like protein
MLRRCGGCGQLPRFTGASGCWIAAGLAGAALAAVLAAPGSGTHTAQFWAGQWDFTHADGLTGGFGFRHDTDDTGTTLLVQIGGTACTEPTDYFAGGYTVPDGTPPPPAEPPGSFGDTGKIRACTVDSDPKHIKGRYQSNGSGGAGDIDLLLDESKTHWSGSYTIDGVPGEFAWEGTFDKHFDGDNALDASMPPYPVSTSTSPSTGGTTGAPTTTPVSCRSADQVPGSCLVMSSCLGKPSTIDLSASDVPFTEVIRGTEGVDVIVGTKFDDTIESLGGDDLICAGGGQDSVYAGPGDDRIEGGDDRDKIDGAEGRDTIHGGDGDDNLSGGDDDARDKLFGEDGWDILIGGDGPDLLHAGFDYASEPNEVRRHMNRLSGGPGNDDLKGSVWMDVMHGGPGADDLGGDSGNDKLYGEGGADTLRGGDEDDRLYFDRADERVNGGGGKDACLGPFLAVIRLFLQDCETVQRP